MSLVKKIRTLEKKYLPSVFSREIKNNYTLSIALLALGIGLIASEGCTSKKYYETTKPNTTHDVILIERIKDFLIVTYRDSTGKNQIALAPYIHKIDTTDAPISTITKDSTRKYTFEDALKLDEIQKFKGEESHYTLHLSTKTKIIERENRSQ